MTRFSYQAAFLGGFLHGRMVGLPYFGADGKKEADRRGDGFGKVLMRGHSAALSKVHDQRMTALWQQ